MSLLMLDQRLDSISKNTPNKIAIECGKEKISYYQLEKETNRIANFFIDNYGNDKNVFVMIDSSINLIKAAIGIIKSSGIFIPVNHNWEDEKIKLMLDEVKGDWIVTTRDLIKRVKELIDRFDLNLNVLVLEQKEENVNYKNATLYSLDNYLEIPDKVYSYCNNKHCYIFFTSGSTGVPKAVLGRYKSLMQFIQWEIEEFKINHTFKISQMISPVFDAFMRDMLVPLCSGGTLCIPETREMILNPKKLINWIEESGINLMHVVPSLFKMIESKLSNSNQFKDLKYILLSGELLRGKYIKRFVEIFGDRIQLVNLYGHTETTLIKMFYLINSSDVDKPIIPVGKPISQCQVYILNNNLKKCSMGVVGELYIRTPYMSSGYVNDKNLTDKVFIKNPFTDSENDIIYKTGDFGRMLSDGYVEVIGRCDNQVKIRGMRIELGEVESKLLRCKLLKEVVVIAKEDENGNKYMCAYVVTEGNISLSEVKKYSVESLPEYMVPSYFKILDSMPLNNNGKIDRKALALIEDMDNMENEEKLTPTNEIETKLLKIFSDTLNVNNIGITNNFFYMGGHSLKVAELISEIYKEFHVEIPVREIYNNPTVKELSEYITNMNKNLMLEILNEGLNKNFGQFCKVVSYNMDLYEAIVLYTNNLNKEILDYIKENSNGKIMLDYICHYNSVSESFKCEDISMEEFSSKLNLKALKRSEIKKMVDNQKIMMERLRQSIVTKNKIKEYEIGCVMQSNCRRTYSNKTRSMMKFTILFKNDNLANNINSILIKLINEQSVLRTSICFDKGTYRFEEHDFVDEIYFDTIDLCQYDLKSQTKAIEEIGYMLDKSMSNSEYLDNILYNFSIIKLSLSQYCFILNIDHQISDVHTPRIIKKYLEEQFNESTKILSYSDYIQNILLANKEEKFNIFNNSLIFKEYKEASEIFYEKYPNCNVDKPIVLSKPFVLTYYLNKNEDINSNESRSILENTIYIVSKILSFQFNLDKIPMGIITNKRIWDNHDYYNTIGNFVDKLPCTFNSFYEQKSDYYDKYIDTETELAKNQIILRELNNDIEFTEYVYKLSPFSLNYIGDYTKIEDIHQIARLGVINTLKYPVKAYSINSSTLRILFNHGLDKETVRYINDLMKELGRKFEYNFY